MILIMIFLGLMIVSGQILMKKSNFSSGWNAAGAGITIFASVFLVLSLAILPINYYSTKAEVDKYYALKDSIEKARSNNSSEVERAALIQEIAQYNKELALVKYWNSTIFDIYIYDGLAELDFLE